MDAFNLDREIERADWLLNIATKAGETTAVDYLTALYRALTKERVARESAR